MVRRDDTKMQALEASRTLNPRPEKVTDPAFGPGGFFDPADLVQVKYEMVRKAEAAGVPGEPGRRRLRVLPPVAVLGQDGNARAGTGRPGSGQAWPQGRPQAHRPGRGPAGGPAGGRPRPAAGGAGRPRSGSVSASASIRVRSSGRCSAAAPPGTRTSRAAGRPPGRRPKADQSGSIHPVITAGDDRSAPPGGMSSCAAPRPPGAADGGTAWPCCSPQGMAAWMAAWTSLPAARAGPGAEPGHNAAAAPRPARPCPPQPRPRPPRASREVMPARRPARRCCPRSRPMPPARSSRCWRGCSARPCPSCPVTPPGGRSP